MKFILLQLTGWGLTLVAAQQSAWGQCGGKDWTGASTCVSNYSCIYINDWYSQCQSGAAATTAITTTSSSPPATTTTASSGLDNIFRAAGKKYFGTCSDSTLLSNTQNEAIIRSDFGALTPENSMKWDAIEKSQNTFTFTGSDTLVNYAQTNGKLVRGHTLVWHSQLPSWVSSVSTAAALTSVIQNHIAALVGRYKGKIYAWDVVNEVFNDDGTFRTSVFYNLLGESFIDIAFTAARAADPAAKLYINDYNLDGAGNKIDALLALVSRLKARGVPIDGIGSQAHLILNMVGGVKTQLQRLADTGLDVAITELDIRIPKDVTTAKLEQQKTDYNTVAKACLSISKCVGITVWGVSDKNSWVDSTFPTYDSPLLYDDNYSPKPAYTGVSSAVA